jgi:NMD protein affecting ribosome stability and mRNA decay
MATISINTTTFRKGDVISDENGDLFIVNKFMNASLMETTNLTTGEFCAGSRPEFFKLFTGVAYISNQVFNRRD